MVTRTLFDTGIFSVIGIASEILVGAKLYWFEAGTSTPIATYTEPTGGTTNANPVLADGAGRFPSIWLEEGPYKYVLVAPDGSLASPLHTQDDLAPYPGIIEGPEGAGLIKVTHNPVAASTYLAGSVGERFLQDKYVTDDDFGGDAGAADNRDAFMRGLDFLDSQGGGNLIVPAASTPYDIDTTPGPLPLPRGVSIIGQGYTSASYGIVYSAASSLRNTGTDFLIQFTTDDSVSVERLGLIGTPGAQGGIRWGVGVGDSNQNGRSNVRHVGVTGFTSSGAAAFWPQSAIRAVVEDFYCINNFTTVLGGGNCGITFRDGNISVNDVAGKALDFRATETGAGAFVKFDDVYFESCPGQYPIHLTTQGTYRFHGRGVFEAMCYHNAGTITNPAIFFIGPGVLLDVDVPAIDYLSVGDNLAGVLSILYASAGSRFRISAQSISMNYNGGGRAGVTYQAWNGIDSITQAEFNIQRAFGDRLGSIGAVRKAYSPLINNLYTPTNVLVEQLCCLYGGASYTYRQNPHTIAVPSAGNSGSTSGIAYPLVQSGAGTSNYTIDTIPVDTISGGREIELEISGFTTAGGGPGNMSASFSVICGTTTTVPISDVAATSRDFNAKIKLKCIARGQYELEVTYMVGSSAYNFDRQALAIDNGVNSIQLRVSATNAAAGDTTSITTITQDFH